VGWVLSFENTTLGNSGTGLDAHQISATRSWKQKPLYLVRVPELGRE
jgi:hypothetical protein